MTALGIALTVNTHNDVEANRLTNERIDKADVYVEMLLSWAEREGNGGVIPLVSTTVRPNAYGRDFRDPCDDACVNSYTVFDDGSQVQSCVDNIPESVCPRLKHKWGEYP